MSFDRIAPFYRTLETLVFGNALQRARAAFVAELMSCRSVLLVGEGDGRFIVALLAANRVVRITCVEQSAKMIQLATRGVRDASRVEFLQSKIEHAVLDHRYDAIVTNFFFDCFSEDELPPIIEKLAQHASSDAMWVVTEFTKIRRGKLLVAAMYAFFRLTTRITGKRLPNYAPLLEREAFRAAQIRSFYGGVVRAELWRRRATERSTPDRRR